MVDTLEGIRSNRQKQVILFEVLIILALASMYYNLAFQKKTDVLYENCNLMSYMNATKTGIATCTRVFTQAFENGYDTVPVTIRNLSQAFPVRESVAVLAGGADYCILRVCPNNDVLCISIRLLNVSISDDRRTECEKLDEICYNHGSMKCHHLTGTQRGCECQA